MLRTLHTIVFVAALLAAVLAADAWLNERRSDRQLAATLASQNALIGQAAAREQLRDTQLAAALAAITAQKRRIQTPRQAADAIPSVMPPLPLPVSIHLPDLGSSPNQTEPPPASISIPQPDLKPLYDSLQECRACALERDATKKDLADEQTRVAALTRERNAAIAAAHGGTFWLRLKRGAKWFVIGVAAGAAATAATHR
ncbi:MAG: hypothetical protein LAN18_01205 [Acidobacteriia bacterium]|nr:hypothetical protein [Terriglobia bacterium]